MKRILVLLAASTAIAGCSTTSTPVATAPTEPVQAPAQSVAPKPQLGTYGFDTAGMDTSVQPGDNFYTFANGTWAKNTPIPADKSNYGMFGALDDLSKERTKTLIEEQAKDPNSRIGAAYASFMDQAAVDAKGLAPFEPWLNQVRGLRSKADLPAIYGEAAQIGVPTPFATYVGQDDKNPDQYILSMYQAGIGMPDRDYYLSKDAKIAETRAKYLQHLTNVLTLAGEANAPARAKAVLDFETRIARAHWNRVDSRDADKTYNKLTVAELQKRAPDFDFAQLLQQRGVKGESLLVAQPSAISGIAAAVRSAPLGVLKDQLLIRSLDAYAPYLPSQFDKEQFAFYGTALSGTPEQEARWKRAVDFTVGALQDDVSKLYVARYFPPETKAAADQLVKNVVEAMGRRIDNLAWMAPATKQRARAKLANFTTKIGYPDQWRDMSGLEIS